jgi:hypothetical protein
MPSLTALGFSQEEVAKVESLDQRSQFQWKGGESVALHHLQQYIWDRRALRQYIGTTDWSVSGKCSAFGGDQTTKLSPFMAFGCLSPRLVYWETRNFEKQVKCKGVRGFINSLLWRDFYRFIVHFAWGDRMFHLYGPTSCGSVPGGHKIPTKWCCKHYNNIFGGSDPRLWDWERDPDKMRRWTTGESGYPFVDAAMHELQETGYLHHLNRETVGWFFVRDLRLDWRLAAEWFESCLIDYDCVLNWGNWAYFVLTQLPAREDDRPGGGPRYTLPRYSPYLMATQVLEWAREHDPKAIYIKRWIPQVRACPPELAREPWLLSNADGYDSDECVDIESPADGHQEGWVCEACTLQNPIAKWRCAACGAFRNASDLGVYASPPIVPPPPEGQGTFGVCLQCRREALGYVNDEDGLFFCGACWLGYAVEGSAVQIEDAEHNIEHTHEGFVSNSQSAGWALIPEWALPGRAPSQKDDSQPSPDEVVLASGCGQEQKSIGSVAEVLSPSSRKQGRSRWHVRGSRSEIMQ